MSPSFSVLSSQIYVLAGNLSVEQSTEHEMTKLLEVNDAIWYIADLQMTTSILLVLVMLINLFQVKRHTSQCNSVDMPTYIFI